MSGRGAKTMKAKVDDQRSPGWGLAARIARTIPMYSRISASLADLLAMPPAIVAR